MKMNKLFAVLAVCLTAFSSCDSVPEGAILESESALVAFPSTQLITELTADNNGILEVALYRGNTSGDLEVEVALEDESGAFALTSPTVSFKDGEAIAYAELAFDMNTLAVTPYSMTLSVTNSELLSPSQQGEILIKASRKLTYKSLGFGVYTSSIFGQSWDQEVLKAEEANVYVLKDCIATGFDILFVLSEDGTELTSFDRQETGYIDTNYGMSYFQGVDMVREDNLLTFTVAFTVSAGSFGEYPESIQLP